MAFRGFVRISTSAALVQFVQNAHHRQPSHKFRDQPKPDQILRFGLAQQFAVPLRMEKSSVGILLLLVGDGFETERFLPDPPAHNTLQPHKRPRRR
jgi:hypothetical protein